MPLEMQQDGNGKASIPGDAHCVPPLSAHCSSLKELLQRSRAVWSIFSTASALNGSVQSSPLDPFVCCWLFWELECVCAEQEEQHGDTTSPGEVVRATEPRQTTVAKQRDPNLTCVAVNTQTGDTQTGDTQIIFYFLVFHVFCSLSAAQSRSLCRSLSLLQVTQQRLQKLLSQIITLKLFN